MNRFNECLAFTLGEEKGDSNDKADHGGLTHKGCTQAVYDDYRRSVGQPPRLVTQADDAEITDIYWHGYWKPIGGDTLPTPLDLVVFDTAVNSGPKMAIRLLQRALGVTDDGIIGYQTQKALHDDTVAGMIPHVVTDYLQFREQNYHRIVNNDPTQARFLDGWLNRCQALWDVTGEKPA